MGNCCSGNANEGEIKLMKGTAGKSMNMNNLFDDRVVLGRKGQ